MLSVVDDIGIVAEAESAIIDDEDESAIIVEAESVIVAVVVSVVSAFLDEQAVARAITVMARKADLMIAFIRVWVFLFKCWKSFVAL